MVHSPMAGVWRHPLGAGNQTELLSSQGTGAGGFQVHLLRCAEVEKSSGGEEPKATWKKLSGASFLLLQCCLSSLSAPSTDSSAPEMFQAGWRSFLLLAFPPLGAPDPVYLLSSCCLMFSHEHTHTRSDTPVLVDFY